MLKTKTIEIDMGLGEGYWRRRTFATLKNKAVTDEQFRAYCCIQFDIQSRTQMTTDMWKTVCAALEQGVIQAWVDSRQLKLF